MAGQPFSDTSGRWTIVYNGELFNFRDLRSELEREGAAFQTQSDTEVVLLGFIHHGERILERLRGMFAFVVWDRATNEIFAARDQVGVKPLYYAIQTAFSEPRARSARLSGRWPPLPALMPHAWLSFLGSAGTSARQHLSRASRSCFPAIGCDQPEPESRYASTGT